MPNIGIIGNGYVGSAIAHGFTAASTGTCRVRIYDVIPELSLDSLESTINDSEFVFVAVPTPMRPDGSIDLSYIWDVFSKIDKLNQRLDNIIVLKSTVIPGTTERIQERFLKLNIVFNPEFLTEKSSRLDFINQQRIILGGYASQISGRYTFTDRVAKLYQNRFKYTHIIETDYKTAEMIKYFCNLFFITKVALANEMKLVSDAVGTNWDTILEGVVSDGRIADSHLNVPGPDGHLGFGGSCFVKDINAFMVFAKSLGINVNTIRGAWETNLEVRPERDWENLTERAVNKNYNIVVKSSLEEPDA